MHAPAAATVIPLPCNNRHRSSILTLSSSSCGHIRLENPLFRIRCRRITRRSASICAELQTSEPMTTTTTTGSSSISTHRITVHDRQRGVVHEFLVPEDQYILHTAESQNISLPFACRHGCCTSCAVRIKSGRIRQPEALGISAELKEVQGIGIPAKHDINELYSTNKRLELNVVFFNKGYALLCVGFPSSDVEVETQDEDEVYWLQFGRYFARGPIERDDYALELAMGDE